MMVLSQTAAVTMHCHMARAGDHSRDVNVYDQTLWFVKASNRKKELESREKPQKNSYSYLMTF